MNNRQLGDNGEDIACKYLEKQGYEILERNKHYSKFCELDIIAKYKDNIVFVEVKTRKTNNFGTPIEAITKSKLEKIYLSAKYYLSQTKEKFTTFYLSAISILKTNREFKIDFIENIQI